MRLGLFARHWLILIGSVYLFACSNQPESKPDKTIDIRYSFFVAGHVYGAPAWLYKPGETYEGGVYPPFRDKFPFIRDCPEMRFGVFAGDIVKKATAEYWDKIDAEIAHLGLPVYFAAGNHDIADRELFEKRYGRTYDSFQYENDLFVILDPNQKQWNISSEQLTFLDSCLSDVDDISHIFVFFHHLLWWDADNKYRHVEPNSTVDRADSINFWSEVESRLRASGREVFMFCGDVGVRPSGESYMYDHYANIHLVATGMGGGEKDNFIIVQVLSDGTVTFRLIALNGDNIDALGRLEDYQLPTAWTHFWNRVWNKLKNL